MDVVVWLRSLGLAKYEAIFRENDIDETVLPSLTHENLKELGVTSFGHRVKLLDAIAALRSDGGGKVPWVDAGTTSSTPSTPPEDRAERRQVTVMFSDLVGSTAFRPAWTRRIAGGHFRLSEVRRGDGGSPRRFHRENSWATGCWSTSATPMRTRTTPNEPCVRGWSWYAQ
jgi:hypothetical protein